MPFIPDNFFKYLYSLTSVIRLSFLMIYILSADLLLVNLLVTRKRYPKQPLDNFLCIKYSLFSLRSDSMIGKIELL